MVRGVKLGAGHLALSPTRVGPSAAPGVGVHGRLFDRFDVDAQAALAPKGPTVHAEIDFRRVEIEALAPELVSFGDARGIVSGRVTADIDPARPLSLDVLLPELWLSVARAVEGANGETTVQRVRVEAARPLHVSVNGDANGARRGALQDRRRRSGRRRAAGRQGDLGQPVGPPGPGAAAAVPRRRRARSSGCAGDLRVELQARGTLDKPDVRGEMTIANPVRLRPKDFDRDIVIGSGRFALDAGGVGVQDLAVTVDGSTMKLAGHADAGSRASRPRTSRPTSTATSARACSRSSRPTRSRTRRARRTCARGCAGRCRSPRCAGGWISARSTFACATWAREVQVQSGIVEISNEGVDPAQRARRRWTTRASW